MDPLPRPEGRGRLIHPPDGKRHPLVLAAIVGIAAGVASAVAVILARLLLPVVPASALVAAMILAAHRPLLARLGHRMIGSRGPVVTALGVGLGVSIMLVVATYVTVTEPIVHGESVVWNELNERICVEGLLAVMGVTALAALVSLLVARGTPARIELRTHTIALLALAASAVLGGFSVLRAAFMPDPDHYLESLPVVARMRAASGTPASVVEQSLRQPVRVYDDRVDDRDDRRIVRRRCIAGSCDVGLVDSAISDNSLSSHFEAEEYAEIEVRLDRAHGVWVLSVPGRELYPYLDSYAVPYAAVVYRVASSVSPPRPWIAGAVLGFALSIVLLARRGRELRRAREIETSPEGVLDASGMVTYDDGEEPMRAAPGKDLVEGPVVVLSVAAPDGGTYRARARAEARLVSGTREELVARAHEAAASFAALAYAACALSGAPLVGSMFAGLVF